MDLDHSLPGKEPGALQIELPTHDWWTTVVNIPNLSRDVKSLDLIAVNSTIQSLNWHLRIFWLLARTDSNEITY